MSDPISIISPMSRAERLDRMDGVAPTVLVIGGGINGASVYRELALNGVPVMLAEKGDFCAGASSALSRMVHGGLRYLENGEFDLVREALDERNRLLANAPHLVRPLRTVVPIDSWVSGSLNAPLKFLGLSRAPSRRGALPVKLGLSFYDVYTRGKGGMPKHAFLSGRAARARFPFRPEVRCAATYYDGQISHPERIVTELFEDVARAGAEAVALNYLEVSEIGAAEVTLRDRIDGREITMRPEIVVNATGAWIDMTNWRLAPAPQPMVQGTKGAHLMLDHPELREMLGDDMVYYENTDGRICIMFNLHGMVLVGSTDIKVPDPDRVRCEEDERDYILDGLRWVFPGLDVSLDHIRHVFAGVRPLPVSSAGTTGQIPRGHFNAWVEPEADKAHPPVLCMIGGKWTTFRAFGELAADDVLKRLGRARQGDTRALPIGGGLGFPRDPEAWVGQIAEETGLTRKRVSDLVTRYGTLAAPLARRFAGERSLAGLPGYSVEEIDYLIAVEQVETLADLALRRTTVALGGALDGAALEAMADRLAIARGWGPDARARALRAFREKLVADHGAEPVRVGLEESCKGEVAAQ
ncbi:MULTISPECIES: glycerol-3-phosphate dehydrogenase/oxidase [Salipiger]|jgi:glycerol-3-phosphate dehydrogenase|uniref:Glycerol-3-phosphate dehydrogenase n=1 Tax=Salipiger profundus TaxID=1229727 RepID=A0A1U7D6J6_9RHOB|nr:MULTISPECIES: glycerol-3-phosphate dehydrogenase/oxidase [Salipiger]APX23680.1 glycerol-3-phosphate dehydrogenase [Salipiger profundus]GGA17179.1 glycerol-3-phosphate dehydrogenase [Salipiger profundus]SFD32041.1 glycerol-3-phosphate dehydrogenase [Salipiger profundus]